MKTFNIYLFLLLSINMWAQDYNPKNLPKREYHLVVKKEKITLGGVSANGMTINGSIPGPTLAFNEGEMAVIHVKNEMQKETSIHWHGLILPNFQDGVPYLNTPPIKPGTTFTYHIPIKQSGTYWYHSHTMLQEQSGVYGSILIHPKVKKHDFDKDLVVVLSDWTHENPEHILKNLKRGNEWYQVKKKTAVPLSRVIGKDALGSQVKMWRDRMEGADIADVYYPSFLTNGKNIAEYPDFNPGEKVRLRFINASASTYYWMDFGQSQTMLISTDGLDVEPVSVERFLFPIAETYDFIITIPEGKLEIIATAQDGSGHTRLHLGKGDLIPAQVMPKPDKIEMMVDMAKMDMKMGAPALKSNPKDDRPHLLNEKYGMSDDHDMEHSNMNHDTDAHNVHENHDMTESPTHSKHHLEPEDFDYKKRQSYFNYDFLKSETNTSFDKNIPVDTLLFNLTGNMNRYVWSINGVPVTETDYVKIKQGRVTRIKINNLTMMHHPMHLHGHFFRVINKNGEKSPLKHTVNVAPMQEVTIEFLGDAGGDWFFHCHVLYHMMGGMTRVMSYGTPRDERMKDYPAQTAIDEMDMSFTWGTAGIYSNFSELEISSSKIRNEWILSAEYGYDKDLEAEISYNRYLNDWVRLYVGVNTENEPNHSLDKFNTVGKLGVKYFTPYMFNVDLSLDHYLRPKFSIEREFLLFPRFFVEGEYEVRTDFGWVNSNDGIETESDWKFSGSYMLFRNLSLSGNYSSQFGWGAGLDLRF